MENAILFKKFLGFSSSNVDKKFYEEFLSPTNIYKDNVNNSLIPSHAPAANGNIVNDDNTNLSYLVKNFTIDDDGCPIGFTVWKAIPYGLASKVYYFGRYWRSNTVTLAVDIPGFSIKWTQIIPQSNLRKRYKVTLEAVPVSAELTIPPPLPINTTTPQAYVSKIIISGKGPVKVNTLPNPDNLKSIIMSGTAPIETAEILPGFLIQYNTGTVDFDVVSVRYTDYITLYPDIIVYINETLSIPLTGNETYKIIPMYHNSPNYLKGLVPYTYDNPYNTYMHYIEKSNGDEIPLNVSDTIIDSDIGMITFNDGIPIGVDALNPIKMSFYQVVPDMNKIDISDDSDENSNINLITNSIEVTETTSNAPQSIHIFNFNAKNLLIDIPNKVKNLPNRFNESS